jgi:hypothetical protein
MRECRQGRAVLHGAQHSMFLDFEAVLPKINFLWQPEPGMARQQVCLDQTTRSGGFHLAGLGLKNSLGSGWKYISFRL